MNSPSLPHDLAALPPGARVFIDANITTSLVILAEVAHRLMILEAIRTLGFPSRTAVKKLKENPDLIRQLSHYEIAIEQIPSFNVTIEPVTFAHLQIAQGLSTRYGLLTNDSLTAAVMQALGITDLASNDPDLAVVPSLTIWRPQP